MIESILTSIKKMLGMDEDYIHFDTDVMIHINSVLSKLSTQLGVGPEKGFSIEDDSATWNDFLPENYLEFESVKTYVYLKVKMIFDPPTSSSVMNAYKEEIKELEWRLNIQAENQ